MESIGVLGWRRKGAPRLKSFTQRNDKEIDSVSSEKNYVAREHSRQEEALPTKRALVSQQQSFLSPSSS